MTKPKMWRARGVTCGTSGMVAALLSGLVGCMGAETGANESAPPIEQEIAVAAAAAAPAVPAGGFRKHYLPALATNAPAAGAVGQSTVTSCGESPGGVGDPSAAPNSKLVMSQVGTAGSAARIAGCADGTLYALNNDRTVWRNASGGRNSGWKKLGTASSAQDISCDKVLWAFNDNRTLWRNDGTPTALKWTKVGQPSGARQVTAGYGGVWALNDDLSIWKSPSGADGSWTKISDEQINWDRITATRTGIWAIDTLGNVARGDGYAFDWQQFDWEPAGTQIANDGTTEYSSLYMLSPDKKVFHGGKWAPNGIEFYASRGTQLMTGNPRMHYVWYGTWSSTDKTILTDLVKSFSNSAYWAINSTYTDSNFNPVPGTLAVGTAVSDSYSQGKSLDDAKLAAIIQAAVDEVGATDDDIFVVMAANDVGMDGYCTKWCAFHSYGAFNGFAGNTKFALVMNPTSCSSGCGFRFSQSPNGSLGADGAATSVAHELMETVTDPVLNAWTNFSAENGDKCNRCFPLTYTTSSGATANIKLGSRDFVLQPNWQNANSGGCVMSYP